MPYISPDDRKNYDAVVKELVEDLYHSGEAWRGNFNYTISSIISKFIDRLGGPRYSHINDIVGVLECIKLELYRRVAAPYEDLKAEENGDVY
tara:strand:+ start:2342 stop:2617 length:276 start_codon:yes stop_codon:yes gene_type:complete